MGVRSMLDPAILPTYLTSGWRILDRGLRGHRRYAGDARAICRQIVEACWTGRHFTASAGHFRQFWIRDLGFSTPALVRLGHGERVRASLAWALDVWRRRGGRVTTTIFPPDRPADVYTLGIDSLPLLLHALRLTGSDDLVRRHAEWLAREVERFGREVVDPATSLVRADRHYSTHRDTVRTRSNAYANAMLALLALTLEETGWLPSTVPPGARERFLDAFWAGDHFTEEAPGGGRELPPITGDANVFPFWLGVAPADALPAALRALDAAGLTRPLPLRYAATRDRASEDPVQRLFVPDYQGTAIWTSLGAIYLQLLWSVDPAAAEPGIAAYAALGERDGTYWEVLDGRDPALRPYRGRFGLWRADEAMLWSSIFLDLLERRAA